MAVSKVEALEMRQLAITEVLRRVHMQVSTADGMGGRAAVSWVEPACVIM
jgi:hypothetical protein